MWWMDRTDDPTSDQALGGLDVPPVRTDLAGGLPPGSVLMAVSVTGTSPGLQAPGLVRGYPTPGSSHLRAMAPALSERTRGIEPLRFL